MDKTVVDVAGRGANGTVLAVGESHHLSDHDRQPERRPPDSGADAATLDPGHLDKKFFSVGKAQDKNDFIVFDKSEKTLSYDKNGKKDGDGTVFAVVKGDAVDADSIFVI